MSLLISLALAAAQGWAASIIFKGSQFDFLRCLIIDIIGGYLGDFYMD